MRLCLSLPPSLCCQIKIRLIILVLASLGSIQAHSQNNHAHVVAKPSLFFSARPSQNQTADSDQGPSDWVNNKGILFDLS
jgi:hypothetical protein